ncbi:MAG: NUDIX hydrolase [Pseudomonadaceae bacterium]|nr:NUDIX hydrolase [Pseudomonadaceae bacterium]
MPPRKPKGQRQRWLYDVRQYAILTDDDGKFLILQLPKEYDDSAANTWTLPGGKLEPSDNPAEGVLREIREETGLAATMRGPCGIARWSTRNSKKLGVFYRASVQGQQPELKLSGEHQRAFWIGLDELADYPFHRKEMLAVIRDTLEKSQKL